MKIIDEWKDSKGNPVQLVQDGEYYALITKGKRQGGMRTYVARTLAERYVELMEKTNER